MSDLNPTAADQQRRATRENHARFECTRDHARRARDLAVAGLLVVAACVPPRVQEKLEPARPQVWVDAFAAPGGDGSRARPLKAVPPLPPGVELHLASGLYAGPFVLPDDALVEGRGEVVLFAEGDVTVVSASRASLSHVAIQGGATGLLASGAVTLDGVRVSGFRKIGVRAEQARLDARGLTVEGTIAGTLGVSASGGVTTVSRASFTGGLSRALMLDGGRAVLRRVESTGAKTLVQSRACDLDAEGLSAAAGSGPALFVSGGRAVLRDVAVLGHEYALQLASGARAEVSGFSSKGALMGAISTLASEATFTKVEIERSGVHGAFELLDSTTTVSDARIREAQSLGLWVRKGRARLARITVEGVAAEGSGERQSQGDAFQFRDAEIDADELTVRDVEGSAVYATAVATVRLGTLRAERTAWGALLVERGAKVTANEVVSVASRGAAVSVLDHGTLVLHRLEASGAEVPLWAECGEGADVELGAVISKVAQPASPCVRSNTQP